MAAKKRFKKPKTKTSTRKQIRKQGRRDKKARRNEYYTNRNKSDTTLMKANNTSKKGAAVIGVSQKTLKKIYQNEIMQQKLEINSTKIPTIEEERANEKRKQMNLQKEMNKNRNKQLKEANLDEDREIKKLEKQLKLNKRQLKNVPKSFSEDGLDYLLEVCNPDSSTIVEHELDGGVGDFEEDLALISGEPLPEKHKSKRKLTNEDESGSEIERSTQKETNKKQKLKSDEEMEDDEALNSECDEYSDDSNLSDTLIDDLLDEENEQEIAAQDSEEEDDGKDSSEDVWEDIYGRMRTQDGSVKPSTGAYIPPAMRAKLDAENDEKRTEKLKRLKRQLKGLINRLAESNMNTVANQIETLFMQNSRHDMNQTLTNLIIDSLISNVMCPERLAIEHVALITILHANVGSEVGAHFLQTIIKMFDDSYQDANTKSSDKKIDNLICIISQLYNFKVFDAKLMYEILEKLSVSFGEKDVECILHVLRNVGFNLRKDDPITLKDFILNVQKRAAKSEATFKTDPRIKFMLEVLLAIKNNNVSKIPNYDVSYPEHLKKLLKGLIRKGQYVNQLSISLEDLLKAEEKGKWWVVGSAWKGNEPSSNNKSLNQKDVNTYSEKLLELARKQRMNTENRRNIFCIIMSAEDYLDAFEKLLRLGLKNQQQREIIHVILHCCIQEKNYNPYYSILVQRFCEYDREYQMIMKYTVWDKLRSLKDNSSSQIFNLAKLLTHLFLEKAVPFSILKIIEFSDLDKTTLRFMRQILLGVLLCEDVEKCQEVFRNVAKSDQLHMFKERLKLFIHHFLLRNLNSDSISDQKKELIAMRAKIVEKVLSKKERNMMFQ